MGCSSACSYLYGSICFPHGDGRCIRESCVYTQSDVTGSNSFGIMTVGDNPNSTANSVMTTVNSNVPWTLAVRDALSNSKPAGTEGKMAEWDGS